MAAPSIGYVSVGRGEGEWRRREGSPLELRDLGLASVSDGAFGAFHVRNTGDQPEWPGLDWHCHDNDMHFFYVLRGSFVVESEDGQANRYGPHDSGCLPALMRHKEHGMSADLEVIMITSPGVYDTFNGLDAELPERATALDPKRRAVATFEEDDAYELGNGPRKFFRYRDLGVRELTDGRAHIHVVRATQPESGTGWHYHSMSQWFIVLGGSSWIRVEDRPAQELEYLDSMCLGSGPQMRHNVAPLSGDYALLEMCVPADYETIAVSPPEGADAPPPGAHE